MRKILFILVLCNFILSDAPDNFELSCKEDAWFTENHLVLMYQQKNKGDSPAIFIRGFWEGKYIQTAHDYWKKDNDFYYFGWYNNAPPSGVRNRNLLLPPELGSSRYDFATLKINRETLKATYDMKRIAPSQGELNFSSAETMQCKTISSREAWRLWDGYKEQNEKNIEAEKERIKKKNKI